MASRFERPRLIRGGIVATLKSEGVASLLGSLGSQLASTASSQAEARRGSVPKAYRNLWADYIQDGSLESPPYMSEVVSGRKTAFARVRPATFEGRYDANQNHTLDTLNH